MASSHNEPEGRRQTGFPPQYRSAAKVDVAESEPLISIHGAAEIGAMRGLCHTMVMALVRQHLGF